MIFPTQEDIGRKVVYRDYSGTRVEEGTITSLRDAKRTFVRYGRGSTSALTKNEQLWWVSRLPRDQ